MSGFACAINCMDGRVQGAVRKYMKGMYGVRFVDKITDAGPVKILAEKKDACAIERIKKLLTISLKNHGSRIVAIAAHYGCAGNPTTKKRQLKQLRKAKKTVQKMITSLNLDFEVEIILLWINEKWMPHEISFKLPYVVAYN